MSSTTVWSVIAIVAVSTALIKGIGPFAMGGRDLSPRVVTLITLLAPAVLAALVATQAFADGDHLAIGADTAGVAAAGISSARGGSIITAVILAAGVTAVLRAIS